MSNKILIKWLLGEDTGISSKQIASVIAGLEPRDKWHYPSDPSDLGRCLRLLELFPDFDIWNMRDVNDEWWRLSNHWIELTDLYNSEKHQKTAPKTYKLMQELISNHPTL